MTAVPAVASVGTRRRSPLLAWVGAGILGLLVVVALAAPLLAPFAPTERVAAPFSPPSPAHPLGTNDVGQDLLSELIHGAQASLLVGTVAALVATAVGALVGVVAGYRRGWVDAVLMRLVDVVLALPVLPLTIVIGVFLGPGLSTQILVIAAVIWAGIARELRAQVLSVRQRDHVQAAQAIGGGPSYVLRRHVAPAVAPLVVPQFVLAVKTAILLEASLAFLGLGDAGVKSWGTTLFFAHARSAFLTDAWLWWVLPPGLAIAATVLSFAFLGYACEERVRPSLLQLRVDQRRRAGLRGRALSRRPAAAPVEAPASVEPGSPALVISDLSVVYGDGDDQVVALNDVSLTVDAGEVVGLVGDSGSGKSTLAAAVVGLLPGGARITGGRVVVAGHDLAALAPAELRRLRGDQVALVPQEAMSALNPVLTIGRQLAEAVTAHRRVGRGAARRRAGGLLELVDLDAGLVDAHPHQLSGGMRQRVVLAMALANDPAMLVADEPTSGLDVILAAHLLDLLDRLRRRLDLAVLVVSHDLPAVEGLADRIAVVHAGSLVEVASTDQLAADPRHPASRRLVQAAPRLRLPVPAAAPA